MTIPNCKRNSYNLAEATFKTNNTTKIPALAPTFETNNPPKYSISWQESFVLLEAYQCQHGDCNVPSHHNSRDLSLGHWVANQRRNANILSLDQRALLNGIGLAWCLTHKGAWNEKFARLQAYHKQHGNCVISPSFSGGTDLCHWTRKQRQLYAEGRIAHDRFERLQSLGFVWPVKSRGHTQFDEKWMKKYERLVAYKKKFGTCAVPFQYKEDKSLGRWVHGQRTQDVRGFLRPDRKKLLNQLEFLCRINTRINVVADRVRPNSSVNKGKDSIVQRDDNDNKKQRKATKSNPEYKCMHGNVAVLPSSANLASWLDVQKKLARDGKLPATRAAPLRLLGVVFNGEDQLWVEHFQRLVEFQYKHGHCWVSTMEDAELAAWMSTQRFQQQQGTLLQDRQVRLVAVEFHFDANSVMTTTATAAFVLVSADDATLDKQQPLKGAVDGSEEQEYLRTINGGIFSAANLWCA